MSKDVTRSFSLAAIVLAVIISISPSITTIANEASTEIYGIDILGLTKNVKNLPEQQFVANSRGE